MKRRITAVIINRANYARVKTVLLALDGASDAELSIVAGSSSVLERFGSVSNRMSQDGLPEARVLHTAVEGSSPISMAKTTGLSVIELSSEFERTEPDVVVTVADRFETLGTAIASSYMNIPLAHTQGGEVSGSIDEKVRHSITKLADLHFPATERAQDFLIRMGEPREKVFLTGCPSIDLAAHGDLALGADFFERAGGVGTTVDLQKAYIVVSQHPVTTSFANASAQINETLLACIRLRDEGFQIAWLWPNIDAGSDQITKTLRSFRESGDSRAFHFYKNFSPEDFLKLINNSACLIGNSSSGIRESTFLGIPTVNIGDRQALRERGPNVVDVGYNSDEIQSACRSQVAHGKYASSQLFGDGTAGEQIANILRTVELTHTKTLNYFGS